MRGLSWRNLVPVGGVGVGEVFDCKRGGLASSGGLLKRKRAHVTNPAGQWVGCRSTGSKGGGYFNSVERNASGGYARALASSCSNFSR
jgi:hypothetical protein